MPFDFSIFRQRITMKDQLAIQLHNRKIFHHYLKQFTPDQLNSVPQRFNNNILWNIGHIIVVQQMLIYGRSGLPLQIPKEWIGLFAKDTRPQRRYTPDEIEAVDEALFSTHKQFETDLKQGLFKGLSPYTTSTQMVLDDLSTTVSFVAFHDGIHLGSILALAKWV